MERQELPQFGFFIALSGCSQELDQCVTSRSTARLVVPGKVTVGQVVAWVLSGCVILFCCLKQFHKTWVHTVFWSKSVCFTPVENDCGKKQWGIIQGEWYLFMTSPNKLPSYAHFLLYFIHSSFPHILTSPRMHVLRCVTQRTGASKPYHISRHFLDWQPWTNFWTDDLYPLGVHCC